MTISSPTNKIEFAGTGSTVAFPFDFKVFSSADLRVALTDARGTAVELIEGAQYSVSLNSDQDNAPGGTITLATAPAANTRLTVAREVEATQLTDITNRGGFYPKVIENALDKLTMLAQQAIAKLSRVVTLPVTAGTDVSPGLPLPAPNSLLGWDASGKKFINYAAQDLGISIVAATWQTPVFTGDGTRVSFTLPTPPGSASICGVALGGVVQTPEMDFTVSGTALTFAIAPPAGVRIAVRYGVALASAGAVSWGDIGGALANQNDLATALAGKANSSHGHVVSALADFAESVDDRVASLLVPGANITLTYDDMAGTLIISAAASGGASWGSITGTLANQADLYARIATLPSNSQSANYTLTLADAGKSIKHPSADTTARSFTIPANASVAFPEDTAVTFLNLNGAGAITIAITSDTLRLAGAGTTGSRTLAANGIATAIKVSATEWLISGVGLT